MEFFKSGFGEKGLPQIGAICMAAKQGLQNKPLRPCGRASIARGPCGGGLFTLRQTCLVPAAAGVHDLHHRKHDGNLDQDADDRRERRARVEAEQGDGGGDGQLKKIAGADQRRWSGDAVGLTCGAVEQIGRAPN